MDAMTSNDTNLKRNPVKAFLSFKHVTGRLGEGPEFTCDMMTL